MVEPDQTQVCVDLNGALISEEILSGLKVDIQTLQREHSTVSKPKIVYIIVGNRTESITYVANKERACVKIGAEFIGHNLSETSTFNEIETLIEQANNNPSVNGIIVQLPLPKNIDENAVLDLIAINKDIDCLNSANMGKLSMKGRNPTYFSCGPLGCIYLLGRYGIEIKGKHAVIIGRSNLVGIPLLLMLQKENATVTLCHSHTHNLKEITSSADIVFVAIGKPCFITGDMVKEGSVIIDIGINAVPDNSEKGFTIVGDADYGSVISKSSFVTPVPGGIGPMTVAMLMRNLVQSWKETLEL